MIYSSENIEYLRESDQMPDWIYYQQNGKTINENYRDQHIRKCQDVERMLQQEKRYKHPIDEHIKEVEKHLTAKVIKTIDKAFLKIDF